MARRFDLAQRLEPVYAPASPDVARRALRAEVSDPAWFLARQWLLGEHDGADAAWPVEVAVDCSETPITSGAAGPGARPAGHAARGDDRGGGRAVVDARTARAGRAGTGRIGAGGAPRRPGPPARRAGRAPRSPERSRPRRPRPLPGQGAARAGPRDVRRRRRAARGTRRRLAAVDADLPGRLQRRTAGPRRPATRRRRRRLVLGRRHRRSAASRRRPDPHEPPHAGDLPGRPDAEVVADHRPPHRPRGRRLPSDLPRRPADAPHLVEPRRRLVHGAVRGDVRQRRGRGRGAGARLDGPGRGAGAGRRLVACSW